MAKTKTENNLQKTNYNALHYDQILIRVMLDGSSGYTIEDIQLAAQTENMTQSDLIKAAICTYCGHPYNSHNHAPAIENLDTNKNGTASPATKKFKSIQLRVKKDGSDNFTVRSLNKVAANAHMKQNDYINAAICSYLALPADYRDSQIGDAVLEAMRESLSPENDD